MQACSLGFLFESCVEGDCAGCEIEFFHKRGRLGGAMNAIHADVLPFDGERAVVSDVVEGDDDILEADVAATGRISSMGKNPHPICKRPPLRWTTKTAASAPSSVGATTRTASSTAHFSENAKPGPSLSPSFTPAPSSPASHPTNWSPTTVSNLEKSHANSVLMILQTQMDPIVGSSPRVRD